MKEYFQNTIFYYYEFLRKEGYNDPLQQLITDFVSFISISKEQKQFVYDTLIPKDEQDMKENINNIKLLIKKMQISNKVDKKALELIDNFLDSLLMKGEE